MKKPERRKTRAAAITNAIPIPLFINSDGFPTKPVIARMNARLTIRTANHGTIVPIYLTAPAVAMNMLAIKNEMKRRNHLFSPRCFILKRTENTTRKTIRNAAIGTKYVNDDKSAGIL